MIYIPTVNRWKGGIAIVLSTSRNHGLKEKCTERKVAINNGVKIDCWPVNKMAFKDAQNQALA